MGHNANQALMGATQSSVKEVTNYPGTLEAGFVAHLKNDNTLAKAKNQGAKIGVSLGKDLSDIGRTAVARKGLRVPLILKADFNPVIGAVVEIDDTEGYGTGDGTKTAVNAVYATGRLSSGGIGEDGNTKGVALIDFPGGL